MNLANPLTIYLLEKDKETTQTIKSLCNEKSLILHYFSTNSELLAAFSSASPSCIIAANDNGQALDLMEQLTQREHTAPVIILGDHNDVSSAVAAIKAGAVDYIEKPTIYGRLAEHLNQVMKRSLAAQM